MTVKRWSDIKPWTAKDREKGECPVDGDTKVRVFFEDRKPREKIAADAWYWGDDVGVPIIGYQVELKPKWRYVHVYDDDFLSGLIDRKWGLDDTAIGAIRIDANNPKAGGTYMTREELEAEND